MRLPLQVVQNSYVPAAGKRSIDDVRADQSRATGNEGGRHESRS
jgi:hypothetical protein